MRTIFALNSLVAALHFVRAAASSYACVKYMFESQLVTDFVLTCANAGEVVTRITFASYGAPTGT